MPTRLCCLIVASFSMLAACSNTRKTPLAAASTNDLNVYSSNGWSATERAEYYHLPEGSELMPYAIVANLTSTKTGKPFLEQMERFGFVPDAAGANNPHGLPIGMTVVRSRGASTRGIEMIGFSCAACHTGDITYRGKLVRIDGAPALINLQAYQIELKDSMNAAFKSPKELFAIVVAMEREKNGPDALPAGEQTYTERAILTSAGSVPAASIADPSFHSISSKAADTPAQSSTAKLSFPLRMNADIALFKARLAYIQHGKLLVDGTEPGPGRIDAFGAARNLLFSQYATKMQSPVSFPYIWSVPDNARRVSPNQERGSNQELGWIHYDGNTNSVLERNIGQALGMGAVYDPKTFESTLRVENLHRLEVLMQKLQAPGWPADLFGSVDAAKAKAGEQIFKAKCDGCHQDHLYSLVDVETDPNRASSFGQPVHNIPFPQAVSPILSGIKKRAFFDDGIGDAEQAQMDVNPVIWRATGQYLARPLKGIWATAPYLHNGSVPTLFDLLHPEQRPAKFAVGSREYDPEKVGYISALGSGWTYDTTQPGNSNIGHSGDKFGTTLPEDQKSDLLEYLKTL